LNTDRIVTFSYAHVPSILPRQKILEDIGFSSSNDKALMYENAYKKLVDAGYISIGMDHYSKPEDDFAIALKNKQLHRNFQGYCTLETTGQVYAFGASSISQLDSAYIQNIKNASQYINSIEKNNLAVLRGYSVNKEQKIIREIINSIMCNYFVDINLISKKYNLTNSELYNSIQFKEDSLEDFISDKILNFNDNKITINESGRLFTRNIAMRFDPLIDQKIGTYSNTV
jgi:oxygen-independent coproporphyrinogen-3 oxidase